MLGTGLCQFENSDRTIPIRNAHLAFQPPHVQHALQRRVEGTFLDLQQLSRNTFYMLSESVTMHWFPAYRLQNHELQSAWKQAAGLRLPLHVGIVHPKYYMENSKRKKSVVA